MAKSFFLNISPRDQLGKLIEDVANSGVRELKLNDLKNFKALCKNGDDNLIFFVHRMLIIQLEKNHCQKRYSALLLIEQLFPRSHQFRTIFTTQANLNTFFQLTLGIDKDLPLPKPKVYQKLLKEKVHQLLNGWIQKFGPGYPYLEQVYKLALSLSSPPNENGVHSINLIVQPVNNNINRISQIDKKIFEYSNMRNELIEKLEQFQNCFKLIIPENDFSLDKMMDVNEEIDEEISRIINTKYTRQQVSITLKPYLEIEVNESNTHVIEQIKDLYKELIGNYIPKIKSLLKYLSADGKRFENEIKQLIELKDKTLELISMYSELRFLSNEHDELSNNEENDGSNFQSDTDDDDFEEVKEKNIEEEIAPENWTEYGVDNPFTNKYFKNNDSNMPSTSGLTKSIYYDPNACNVKMKNGTLCPRKDKRKCPFHGKIIERDHDGKPLDAILRKQEEEEQIRRSNDWQDPDYLNELKNQIGIDLTIKKVKIKKNPELLNLKTCDETTKTRLIKRMKNLRK